jgi:hypothetical protein
MLSNRLATSARDSGSSTSLRRELMPTTNPDLPLGHTQPGRQQAYHSIIRLAPFWDGRDPHSQLALVRPGHLSLAGHGTRVGLDDQ